MIKAVIQRNKLVVVPKRQEIVVRHPLRGLRGETGPAATEIILVAGEALGGHRIVSADTLGIVSYIDLENPESVSAVVGMTTHAADSGANVVIQQAGTITEPSWNWLAAGPVYCGVDGVLTQTLPSASALLQVGTATGSHSILIRIGVPIFLA